MRGRKVARAEEAPSRDALRGILHVILSSPLTAISPRPVMVIQIRSYRPLTSRVSDVTKKSLDGLLELVPDTAMTRLTWLRNASQSPAPTNILGLIEVDGCNVADVRQADGQPVAQS